MIKITDILIPANGLRKNRPDPNMDEMLFQSIQHDGLLNPIHVMALPEGTGKYLLREGGGFQRIQIFVWQGRTEIPAIVEKFDG
jgi:ParB-like nuclease domain